MIAKTCEAEIGPVCFPEIFSKQKLEYLLSDVPDLLLKLWEITEEVQK